MTVDDWLRQALQAAEGRRIEGLPALLETLAVSTRALRAADWNLPADQTLTSAGIDPGAGPRPAPSPRSDAVSEPPAARRTGAAEPRLRSIAQLALALRTGALSSGVLTEACLAAIEVRNPDLNAFITVTASLAREQARRADQELAGGHDRGPLHGIPISLKDLVDLEGYPTTAASRVRAGLVATRDATVSARLKAAGAVIVGKCNLHEFAFGTTNEDSAYGPARHPIFPDRSPGGSSGGSAAAVAAGLCAASVGTDTGGSIRIPAAACGIVGFKPPFGRSGGRWITSGRSRARRATRGGCTWRCSADSTATVRRCRPSRWPGTHSASCNRTSWITWTPRCAACSTRRWRGCATPAPSPARYPSRTHR
jgi:hypothetical protein